MKEKAREILYRYDTNTDLSREDFDFMFNILAKHENASDKIGVGVKRMWIEMTRYNNRGFWLERTDGTKTDFSFYKCFTKTNNHSDFLKACRKAIEYIVIDFRDATFADQTLIRCPITDVQMTKYESHVDHFPIQFIEIARDFFNLTPDIKFVHGDGIIGVEFADKEVERQWVDFHNKYARLRVISEKANLKLKKKRW